jgi:hypothetical protein
VNRQAPGGALAGMVECATAYRPRPPGQNFWVRTGSTRRKPLGTTALGRINPHASPTYAAHMVFVGKGMIIALGAASLIREVDEAA